MTLADDATAVAILNLDNSRRVGWAKAYEATSKLDGALHDFNIAKGDRDAFRKGLSFLYGLFMEWTKNERSEVFTQVLTEIAGYDAVLDAKLVATGRRKARQIRAADEVWEEERRLARQARKRANSSAYMKAYDDGRERARIALAAKYGFRSVPELEEVLLKWQTATNRPPTDTKSVKDATIQQKWAQREKRRREQAS
jgi:hypothetical protein